MTGRWAAVVVVAALGGVVVACSADASKGKTVICEDEGKSCPEQIGKAPSKAGAVTSPLPVTPVDVDRDSSKTTPPDTDAGTDAGADAEAPPRGELGPLCADLTACCQNLRAAGITGSAMLCDDVVADRNEFACLTTNDYYKTPEDQYEPVCF